MNMSDTITELSKRASGLGFKLSAHGNGLYRMVLTGTSYGYQGTLVGCNAYLQGWEESVKFHSHKW